MCSQLQERWQRLWRNISAVGIDLDLYQLIVGWYSEPHRHYHTLTHLVECFNAVDLLKSWYTNTLQWDDVETALWFHDAVYDTRRHNNEVASAGLARQLLINHGVNANFVTHVCRLIEGTDHRDVDSGSPVFDMVKDADLSILGSSADRYALYEQQIRQEYDWVPFEHFKQARAEVLQRFLDRRFIYGTRCMRERYEDLARTNLTSAVAVLK